MKQAGSLETSLVAGGLNVGAEIPAGKWGMSRGDR